MIKDYPDTHPAGPSVSVPGSYPSSAASSISSSPNSSVVSLPTSPVASPPPSFASPPQSFASPALSFSARLAAAVSSTPAAPPMAAPTLSEPLPPPRRTGPLPPPPQHPSATPQTTYTPYVPRARRLAAARAEGNPPAADGRPVPVFASSAQGGVTARVAPGPGAGPGAGAGAGTGAVDGAARAGGRAPPSRQATADQGPSAALLDKVRQLDALPRLGALRTLDLKGNEIRVCPGPARRGRALTRRRAGSRTSRRC
jgi:protein phosphatase 1 regulatory subunit 37